jgi:hypothetical protein
MLISSYLDGKLNTVDNISTKVMGPLLMDGSSNGVGKQMMGKSEVSMKWWPRP